MKYLIMNPYLRIFAIILLMFMLRTSYLDNRQLFIHSPTALASELCDSPSSYSISDDAICPQQSNREANLSSTSTLTSTSSSSQNENIQMSVFYIKDQQDRLIFTSSFIRQTVADKHKIDEVTFTDGEVIEMIATAYLVKANLIKVVIPDQMNDVEQINLTIQQKFAKQLIMADIDFAIKTECAMVVIPSRSLRDTEEDLHFTIIPNRNRESISIISETLKKNTFIEKMAGDKNNIQIVGVPIIIITNLNDRLFNLYFPVEDIFRHKNQFKNLHAVSFHSNGQLEVLTGHVMDINDELFFTFSTENPGSLSVLSFKNKVDGGWWISIGTGTMLVMIAGLYLFMRSNRLWYKRKDKYR